MTSPIDLESSRSPSPPLFLSAHLSDSSNSSQDFLTSGAPAILVAPDAPSAAPASAPAQAARPQPPAAARPRVEIGPQAAEAAEAARRRKAAAGGPAQQAAHTGDSKAPPTATPSGAFSAGSGVTPSVSAAYSASAGTLTPAVSGAYSAVAVPTSPAGAPPPPPAESTAGTTPPASASAPAANPPEAAAAAEGAKDGGGKAQTKAERKREKKAAEQTAHTPITVRGRGVDPKESDTAAFEHLCYVARRDIEGSAAAEEVLALCGWGPEHYQRFRKQRTHKAGGAPLYDTFAPTAEAVRSVEQNRADFQDNLDVLAFLLAEGMAAGARDRGWELWEASTSARKRRLCVEFRTNECKKNSSCVAALCFNYHVRYPNPGGKPAYDHRLEQDPSRRTLVDILQETIPWLKNAGRRVGGGPHPSLANRHSTGQQRKQDPKAESTPPPATEKTAETERKAQAAAPGKAAHPPAHLDPGAPAYVPASYPPPLPAALYPAPPYALPGGGGGGYAVPAVYGYVPAPPPGAYALAPPPHLAYYDPRVYYPAPPHM